MSGDGLRFLAGEDVESPRQRPAEGELPRETAARRLAEELERRVRELQDLYGRWGFAAEALMEIRARGLEARLDAGAASAFVQVRNSQWGTMGVRDMLGAVVRAFGIMEGDIRNATHQETRTGGDVLSFSVALAPRPRPGSEAPEGDRAAPAAPPSWLNVNFTLMGQGTVVGHWPPS